MAEADPVADARRRVLSTFEAVAMNALFLECADHALDYSILLRTVQRDEITAQAMATNQSR